MTIHITPEEEYSYVSFETNIEKVSYQVSDIRTTAFHI